MNEYAGIDSFRPMSEREFRFTTEDFQMLSAMAGRHAGINLTEAKRELVYSRLARRLRQLGLQSFAEYCDILRREDAEELEIFTNAITTNLTSFFREVHHFNYLRDELVPAWLDACAGERQPCLRIWCAGCSTGEEPYSVAMTVLTAFKGQSGATLDILATDLDSNVLSTAAKGVYPMDRLNGVPEEYLRQWFLRGRGRNEGMARVSDELRQPIRFRKHNMVQERPPNDAKLDAIFCRNVVIYFDKPTQDLVYRKFSSALRAGGYLMVGHSESLFNRYDELKLVARSTYQKQA
ncbi:MAG: protein-glutamate O-methyltransferase CheR [Xanthomonadales bacterium]|nr:protein-glutamate O-methyltransferase CheR [Xanthomonadales bacterium]